MFYNCTSIRLITITGLNGSKVKSMKHMFRSCESLNILELPNLIVSDSVDMKKLFYGANKTIDIRCPSMSVQTQYTRDKYDENSSSAERLNDIQHSSDNEQPIKIQINQPDEEKSPPVNGLEEFPHVLTAEQRSHAFKWAIPPQSIIPEF